MFEKITIIRRGTWKMINIKIKFKFQLYISYLSAYLLNKYINYLIQILSYIILCLKYIKHFNGSIKSYHFPVNDTPIKRKKLKSLALLKNGHVNKNV